DRVVDPRVFEVRRHLDAGHRDEPHAGVLELLDLLGDHLTELLADAIGARALGHDDQPNGPSPSSGPWMDSDASITSTSPQRSTSLRTSCMTLRRWYSSAPTAATPIAVRCQRS